MFNIQGQSASMATHAYTDSEYIGMYCRVLGAFRKRVLRSAASFTVTATQHNNKVRVENTKEMLANQKRTKTVQEGEAGLTGIENEEMNNSS